MNKQAEQELLDRVSQLETQIASLLQIATDSTGIVDRISKLESQVRSILPPEPKISPTDEKFRRFNESKRNAEIDSMIDATRKSTIDKPKEPPLPSIAGKSVYQIDDRTIPVYGVVTIEQLADILETDVQSIENDAAKFGLTLDELIQQCTKLKAIVYPGEGKKYMRSPV